ncbi:glycoside hydrolase family 10 protein [Pseudanabaena sp. FACHB-1998]|uniref:family 10 glycosylhydrolase n=1 Tax=Pseudanabaena sp. FACHB-1998 TaxID=2692858 RepID=UPI001F54F95E|nr:glycoside hydrolase family 10 protein [Pseudanabaena sp. FACHB-1998]
MSQNWRKFTLKQRSRKRFLSAFFALIFAIAFAFTLVLHSFLPSFIFNDQADQAIAQTSPQSQRKQSQSNSQRNQSPRNQQSKQSPSSSPKNAQLLPQPLIPPLPPVNPTIVNKKQEIRGVWLTSNDFTMFSDRKQLSEALQQLKQLNFNTIYPVVWNGGYVMYPSSVAQREGIQPFVYRGSEGQDIVADIIAQAHQHDLLVMPWFEFGFMAPPTSELALTHPNWLTQERNGDTTSITAAGEVAWLNPFHPEVQKFLTELVLEAVTNYDLDGIQFDDHTSLPKTFGYDRYTLSLYKQETKKDAPADVDDPAWVRWRANKLTAFMANLNKAVKQRKPNVIFSVSPNYYEFAYKQQLQDWLGWVRQNIVDELIVQVYRNDLDDFRSQVSRAEIVEVQNKISTGIGILSGLRNSNVPMSRVYSQVITAQERGLGISFFYYKSLWGYGPESVSDRQKDLKYLFRSPAPRLFARGSF